MAEQSQESVVAPDTWYQLDANGQFVEVDGEAEVEE